MSCCCKVQMEFLLLIHFEQVTKGYLSVHVAYYIRIHLISKIKNEIRKDPVQHNSNHVSNRAE